jgi:hypothetical protein
VNRSIVAELAERRHALTDVTADDARRVIGRWHFPLAGIDLTEIEVPSGQLEASRARYVDLS